MSARSLRRAAERESRKLEQKSLKSIAQGQTMNPNSNNSPSVPEVPMIDKSNNRSTGPVTPQGKSIASQNSVRHGCCSDSVRLLKDESMMDYLSLENVWFEGYNREPFNLETLFEAELIRACVDADWLARRAERLYSNLEADLLDATPELQNWTEEQYKKLALANRYRVANRNTLAKVRKTLEDYRKARGAEALKEQKLTYNEEKLTVQKEKHAPEPTWEEQLAEARAISIRLGYINPDGSPTGKK